MTYDRKDHVALVAAKEQRREQDMMPMYRMLSGAAPVMTELVTGSDAWDRYLQILQGFVDRAKSAKARAEAQLADPAVWEPYQLMKLKSDILTSGAMVEALMVAMELPKALIEGGDAAKLIVSKFEAKHEQPAGQAQP